MTENNSFKFKIKINGYSYDFDKNTTYDNGFTKTYYANNFEELKKVFIDFINGENRFIGTKFDKDTKEIKYTKYYADETNVSEELIEGLEQDLIYISDKVYFVMTSQGTLNWWDRLLEDNRKEDFCNATNENVEYVATIRLVVNKDDKVNE